MLQTSSFGTALHVYHKNTKDHPKAEDQGVLVYQGDWKILKGHLSSEVIQKTIEKVVSLELNNLNLADLMFWIKKFNSAMALSNLKEKKIRPIENNAKIVQFNSMNEYRWLSNFFTTLIYDPKYAVIYPSVESGYVAFKARKAENDDSKGIEYARIIDPKEVKRKGQGLWQRKSDEDNHEAIAEMTRLVALKFQQNPFIAAFLQKSEAQLEEFTNDSFWGSAMGTAMDENSNHLGKIIQNIRNA